MKEDEDDDYFDPRLRWARENREDLSLILIRKKRFDAEMNVLKTMEENPGLNHQELYGRLNISTHQLSAFLTGLRQKNVKILSKKDKDNFPSRYWIAYRPKRIPFIYEN